ncbi:MAG: hypothetical protein V1863_05180 [Candidatus Omnitrophota bacterium]
MNKKQVFALVLGTIAIILIVIFTPRYKITWIDSVNFVKTEQTSSLYKRSKGTVKLHWDKILFYGGAVLAGTAVAFFALRESKKTNG